MHTHVEPINEIRRRPIAGQVGIGIGNSESVTCPPARPLLGQALPKVVEEAEAVSY
jgi:hypothetical protein